MSDPRWTRKWKAVRRKVLRPGATCHWCGDPATEADHVQPVSRGGAPFALSNVVPSCRTCNRKRGNRGTVVGEQRRSVFSRGTRHTPPLDKISLPRTGQPLLRGDYSRGVVNARRSR